MNVHADVATKVLTREFYRANAMFFLVAIGFCFGFMRGAEHLALAHFFVGSTWLVMIPVGVWVMYTIKVILYNDRQIRVRQHLSDGSTGGRPSPCRGCSSKASFAHSRV
jgi:hypothetical protein